MREYEVVAEILALHDRKCVREAPEACSYNVIHLANLRTKEKFIQACGG